LITLKPEDLDPNKTKQFEVLGIEIPTIKFVYIMLLLVLNFNVKAGLESIVWVVWLSKPAVLRGLILNVPSA